METRRTTAMAQDLLRDTRGALPVEYVVLVGTVGLVLMFALVAIGPNLVKDYEGTRQTVNSPYP